MGWFTRKQQRPASTDRYVTKPLLVLMDSYVLSVIGELPPEEEVHLLTITQRAYGGRSDWLTTMRGRFQLSASTDELVRQMWVSEQERAQQEGRTLAPKNFARAIVDENFAHLIE